MRRWTAIAVLVLVILGGVALGVGAYHAGYTHGLEASGRVTQIVREGPGGFGFIFFPLLFFFLIFFLLRVAFFGRRWGGYWGHDHGEHGEHGEWRGPRRFEEWHRRQHEQGAGDHPGAGGEPAGV